MKIILAAAVSLLLFGCGPKMHHLSTVEEFDLRGRCADLGLKMQAADKASKAADEAADEARVAAGGKPSNTLFSEGWRFNYSLEDNRCYAVREEGSLRSSSDVTTLYDAQTRQELALTGQGLTAEGENIKRGVLGPFGSETDVGYAAAKKFIDHRMNE